MAEIKELSNAIERIQSNIASEIFKEQATGTVHWHLLRRSGLARRALIARYQITQLVGELGGKENRKYRKHFNLHNKELRDCQDLPLFVDGKNQYNQIGKRLNELLEAIQLSSEKVAESSKDFKLKKFGSKSKAVFAEINQRLDALSEGDVVVEAEAVVIEESKVA